MELVEVDPTTKAEREYWVVPEPPPSMMMRSVAVGSIINVPLSTAKKVLVVILFIILCCPSSLIVNVAPFLILTRYVEFVQDCKVTSAFKVTTVFCVISIGKGSVSADGNVVGQWVASKTVPPHCICTCPQPVFNPPVNTISSSPMRAI